MSGVGVTTFCLQPVTKTPVCRGQKGGERSGVHGEPQQGAGDRRPGRGFVLGDKQMIMIELINI